jgi:hypothetical protein
MGFLATQALGITKIVTGALPFFVRLREFSRTQARPRQAFISKNKGILLFLKDEELVERRLLRRL